MGFLTKYGTLWGDVPQTAGQVLWVAPAASYTVDGKSYVASDGNDGLSPERALLTINRAIVLATASVGDVIMLLPGSHTDSVTVTLNKAGLTFVAAHPATRISPNNRNYALGSKVTWTSTFAGVGITNTAADTTFVGIKFVPVTAQSMMTCIATPRNAWIDCAVVMSATVSTSTKGFVFSGAAGANCSWTNCVFLDSVASSAQGPALDLTGAIDFYMYQCSFLCTGTSSAWAVAIQCGAATSGVVEECFIGSQNVGTITIGIDGTGVIVANSVNLVNNRYGVSPGEGAAKNFANDEAPIVRNYYATVGAGVGFVIQSIVV